MIRLIRTLNKIIDEINQNAGPGAKPIPHGRNPIECLNNIIGGDTKYRSIEDAVEFLARDYVKHRW